MDLFFSIGVDTILQKTQEDLGRIKKTSYFQRNKKPETPTPGEENKSIVTPSGDAQPKVRWIGFEGKEEDDYQEEESSERRPAEGVPDEGNQAEAAQPPEEAIPEEEEEQVDDDDIFNTDYIDAVTCGDLKLHYVPDSPTEGEAQGDDPFDTSAIEKSVGPLPVIKKKKALVSIGSAAEVLAAANAAGAPVSRIRRRIVQPPTEIQLLGCLDDDLPPARPNSTAVTPSNNNSRAPSIPATPQPLDDSISEPPPAKTPDIRDILAEFDVIPENAGEDVTDELIEKPAPPPPEEPAVPQKPQLIDEEDFEFEALAYESLAKNPQLPEPVEEEDDPFDTSCVEKVLKSVEPVVEKVSNKSVADPVQTSAAPAKTKNLPPPRPRPVAPPGRPLRPPVPAAVVLPAIDPVTVVVQPTAQQQTAAPLQAQDSFDALFLNDSPTDVPAAVQTVTKEDTEQPTVEEDDPFDTSVADKIVIGLPAVVKVNKAQVTADFLEEDPQEDDPFDTSAVEKILN